MNWKERFFQLLANHPSYRLWFAVIFVAGFAAFYWDQKGAVHSPETQMTEEAATYIPEGFVLVPIEVANYESLDSILGKFGVVDLCIPAAGPGKRPIKIAERIKILRAPLNPSRFAVLAPEEESSRIVANSDSLYVAVQNPSSQGTRFVNSGDSEANEGGEKSEVAESADAGIASRKNKRKKRSRILVEVSYAESDI